MSEKNPSELFWKDSRSVEVAGDFDRIIMGAYFPAGSAFEGHQILASTAELYPTLSALEKEQLRDHYFAKLNSVKADFPRLCSEFEEQLR